MWQLDGSIARIGLGQLTLTISLAVGDRKVQVHTPTDLLLATLWDMPAISRQPLVDCYVRQGDLVCTLAPNDSFPFHTQLYWTLGTLQIHPTPVASLSLLVSLRTDLLDTHPEITITSQAPPKDLRQLQAAGGPAFIVPLRDEVSLIDFATPEDCTHQQATCSADSGVLVERKLFGHFLEKGVIRSGRVFAALATGEVSDEYATQVCREFVASELPLTT